MKEKKRPTLEQLESAPVELVWLELSQVCEDAREAGLADVEREASELLSGSTITAIEVVELRNKLQSATGSTAAA
jgi:hypothetical protein